MSNSKPNKPKANHPWKRRSIKVETWAQEQSTIHNVTNVVAARPETLARKKKRARASVGGSQCQKKQSQW